MNDLIRLVGNAKAGLRFEHDLFVAEGPRVGQWTASNQGIVCPRAYRLKDGFEELSEHCASIGWPVHLRPTGGGAVPQGPGISNLALAFNAREGVTIEDVYKLLTGILKDALGSPGKRLEHGETPGSFCDGAWNLSFDGQKLIGTAQRWQPQRGKRPRVLAHAMILVSDDFQSGTDAVAEFHKELGLSPVRRNVHISLNTAFGVTELPSAALQKIALTALSGLHVEYQ
ncbi:MAG: hypothetical protein AAF066_09055 [Pseudomonadota bacterium]